MLRNLHVKNFALIQETEVEFGTGLNILTGETGAGKSIIIGSINLALGGKVSKEMVRENAEYALVELDFDVREAEQVEALKALDIFPEEGQVIFSRKIMNGRSVSKINGETVTANTMQNAADILIDLHGQHEHQSLLYKRNHLDILDEFAKTELAEIKIKLSDYYKKYIKLEQELNSTSIDEEKRMREISFTEYEIREIDEACLKKDEDEILEEQYQKMLNSKKILDRIKLAYYLTEGSEDGNASSNLGRALKELRSIENYDAAIATLVKQLEEIDNLLNDFNREMSDYSEEMNFSEEKSAEIEERLNLINHLKAKYGKSVQDILEYRQEKQCYYEKLINHEQYVSQLKEQLKEIEKQLKEKSERITEIRQKYAIPLAEEIRQALEDLNFLDVRFELAFSKLEQYGANGWDDVEFMISTNPGEKVKQLAKVASGGELSRIMLAIKTVLAEKDKIETLIFDEIDVGISGRTAQKVSEKLALIGKNHQVICITHLPQIAAMADHHYSIEKSAKDGGTITTIHLLDETASIAELARILGGAEITNTVYENAKEMKNLANQSKLGKM